MSADDYCIAKYQPSIRGGWATPLGGRCGEGLDTVDAVRSLQAALDKRNGTNYFDQHQRIEKEERK